MNINKINDRKSLTKSERAYLLGYMDGMETCFLDPSRGKHTTRMADIGIPAEFSQVKYIALLKRGFKQAEIDYKLLNAHVAKYRRGS